MAELNGGGCYPNFILNVGLCKECGLLIFITDILYTVGGYSKCIVKFLV